MLNIIYIIVPIFEYSRTPVCNPIRPSAPTDHKLTINLTINNNVFFSNIECLLGRLLQVEFEEGFIDDSYELVGIKA